MDRIKTKESGFTVVELLVYTVIFIAVLGAIYGVFLTNLKAYTSQENRLEMTQDMRAGIGLMVREIRMAGYDPTFSSNFEIIDADGDSIHFTMDLNEDGITGDPNENIRYEIHIPSDGIQKLTRSTNGGAKQPVIEHITDLQLSYSVAGTTVEVSSPADPADIRAVRISIDGETINKDPITGKHKTWGLTSRANVRNAGLE